MAIDINEAKKIIMQMIENKPSGVGYPNLDRMFVWKMPDMIFGDEIKLMPLLDDMVNEGVIQRSGHGYVKGPNFPEHF